MNSIQYIRINPDSSIEQITESAIPVDITQEILAELASSAALPLRNVFDADKWGPVNCSLQLNEQYYTLSLSSLTLFCRWSVIGGVLTPDFSNGANPIMPNVWTPPSDMCLIAVFKAKGGEIQTMWLMAVKAGPTFWRLPLGNLHTDCHVCTGSNRGFAATTAREAIIAAMNQLEKSQWNSDLHENNENTAKMFRFQAKDDHITQLPITATTDWTTLCTKVAPAILNRVVLS